MTAEKGRAGAGGKRSKKRKKRVGLSRREEERIRQDLRPFVPSEPWINACLPEFTDVSPDGEQIVYRFYDAHAFPPQADSPACQMQECSRCGRIVPAPTFEPEGGSRRVGYGNRLKDRPRRVVCADCRSPKVQRAHGASPSAVMLRKLRDRMTISDEIPEPQHIALEEMKLPPADAASLKRQIARYERGQKKKKIRVSFTKSPNIRGS